MVGNLFLKDIVGEWESIKHEAEKRQTKDQKEDDYIPPYILEYFNVHVFHLPTIAGEESSVARIINTTDDAIYKHARLPKYLLVVMDKDLMRDVNMTDSAAPNVTQELMRYLVRQIDMLVRRTKGNFLEKKPGAHINTKIIFIRMIRRIGKFSEESFMHAASTLKAKMNNSMNDTVAKIEQYILTINSCYAYEHFDRVGNLSSKGKNAFWNEISDLINKFEIGKVKLLPNPKNPPNKAYLASRQHHQSHWSARYPNGGNQERQTIRRRLPTPLAHSTRRTISHHKHGSHQCH